MVLSPPSDLIMTVVSLDVLTLLMLHISLGVGLPPWASHLSSTICLALVLCTAVCDRLALFTCKLTESDWVLMDRDAPVEMRVSFCVKSEAVT